MARKSQTVKLLQDVVRFAREQNAYWLIPLVVGLLIAGTVIAVGQVAAPLLYTLF